METKDAIKAIAALAHLHRMEVFRLLVTEGPDGLAAGDIADRLEIRPSALSFHLGHLERSGLIHSRRAGRHSIYAVDIKGMRTLLEFLTRDCCKGNPEICGGLVAGFDAWSNEEGAAS